MFTPVLCPHSSRVPLDILPLDPVTWLTFSSSFSCVCSLTNDITVSSKILLQLFSSLTPPLAQAATQTYLNDCHLFPAKLPTSRLSLCHLPLTTRRIFQKWTMYQTHTQNLWTLKLTQDSSGPDSNAQEPHLSPLLPNCSHPHFHPES